MAPAIKARPYVIAVFNQKGGVAKTTTSTNLALCLAALNRSVTLIDLDSQGNATTSLGFNPPPNKGAYQVLMGEIPAEQALVATIFPKLNILASSEALSGVDFELALEEQPQDALKRVLQAGGLTADYVIIDCPPTFSMLPVNALVCADAVVIPIHPTPLAHDGLIKAWGNIKRIQAKMNANLSVHGLLITMAEKGDTEGRMEEVIRQEFGDKVYDTVIPRDPRVADAAVKDLPVTVFDPKCPATRAYVDFAEEFILREPILRHRRYPGKESEDGHIHHFRGEEHSQAIDAALRTIDMWHEQIKSSGSKPDFLDDSLAPPPSAQSGKDQWIERPEIAPERPISWGAFLAGALIMVAFFIGMLTAQSEAVVRLLSGQ